MSTPRRSSIRRFRSCLLLSVLALAGCGAHPQPRLTITPATALVDTPLRIVARGLKPHARVVATARTVDLAGRHFRSRVVLRADARGVVRVPMSLLRSMRPTVGTEFTDVLPWRGQQIAIAVGEARGELRWLVRAPGVAERELRPARDGIYGDFFRPPSARRAPAVLLFGGSEGGLSVAEQAALLASRGFPTLALAYFGLPGLPGSLNRVRLEYFERALTWLARQPGVDRRRLVAYGISRGSEAALLLGVHDRRVRAVVALVPGNVVLCAYQGCGGPAWTLGGRPIPFQRFFGPSGPDPIRVERIRGPVFMDCGSDDQLWPSCPMAQAIARRRPRLPTTLLVYQHAGHGVGDVLPNVPQEYPALEGTTPLTNARARADAWATSARFPTLPSMTAFDPMQRRLAELEELGRQQVVRMQDLQQRGEHLGDRERHLREVERDLERRAEALAGRERDADELDRRAKELDDRALELNELERALDERTAGLARITDDQERREAAIVDLERREANVREREQALPDAENAVLAAEGAVAARVEAAAAHERELAARESGVAERETAVDEREALLRAESNDLAREQAAVAAERAEIDRRLKLLDTRSTRLADGETALTHQMRAARAVAVQAEEATRMMAEAEQRAAGVDALLKELDERGDLLVAAEQAIAERERVLADQLDRMSDAEAFLEQRERSVEERERWLERREELLAEGEQALFELRQTLR